MVSQIILMFSQKIDEDPDEREKVIPDGDGEEDDERDQVPCAAPTWFHERRLWYVAIVS